MADAPGFYGKAVTRGDFVSRRLPAGFLPVWDAWLQGMMDAARTALGEAWLAAFLAMPVWHFALGRGIAGQQPVLGVLIPSVDRVGRYFPFTILGSCAAGGMDAAVWAARVEGLALGALEDDFDPAVLDAALAVLGPPSAGGVPGEGESLWWVGGGALRVVGLPTGGDVVELVRGKK